MNTELPDEMWLEECSAVDEWTYRQTLNHTDGARYIRADLHEALKQEIDEALCLTECCSTLKEMASAVADGIHARAECERLRGELEEAVKEGANWEHSYRGAESRYQKARGDAVARFNAIKEYRVKLAMAMDAAEKGDKGRAMGTALEEAMKDLAASQAREARLREALERMVAANGGVAVLPTLEAREQNAALAQARKALAETGEELAKLSSGQKIGVGVWDIENRTVPELLDHANEDPDPATTLTFGASLDDPELEGGIVIVKGRENYLAVRAALVSMGAINPARIYSDETGWPVMPGDIAPADTSAKRADELQKGDYVLATKYSDGDPGDHWVVGFYDGVTAPHYDPPRYNVVDEEGKNFRGNGFRRVEKITRELGEWMLANQYDIERSGSTVWDFAKTYAAQPADETAGEWLIWCKEHSKDLVLWWRPNSAGYTTNVLEAGRYSEDEALSIVGWSKGRDEVAFLASDVLALPHIHVVDQHHLNALSRRVQKGAA